MRLGETHFFPDFYSKNSGVIPKYEANFFIGAGGWKEKG
jgi:hypothetical protein